MTGGGDDERWAAALGGADGLLGTDGGGSFAARLDRWVADARIDAAALQRSREHWLAEVAAQEASLVGVLAEMAERGTPVSLRIAADRVHHGVVQVIGSDFVALRTGSGGEVLVALSAIGVLRTAPTAPAVGDRVIATELRLTDVLAELAADREHLLLVTRDGADSVSGQLRSVGRDVVVLRTDGAEPTTVYVAAATIGEVSIG